MVESTIKALVEFETELDGIKAEVLASKKRMVQDATDLAESARSKAVAKAQSQASEMLVRARSEAEAGAKSIGEKGAASLKSLESSISKRKSKATESVVASLLGEKQ